MLRQRWRGNEGKEGRGGKNDERQGGRGGQWKRKLGMLLFV